MNTEITTINNILDEQVMWIRDRKMVDRSERVSNYTMRVFMFGILDDEEPLAAFNVSREAIVSVTVEGEVYDAAFTLTAATGTPGYTYLSTLEPGDGVAVVGYMKSDFEVEVTDVILTDTYDANMEWVRKVTSNHYGKALKQAAEIWDMFNCLPAIWETTEDDDTIFYAMDNALQEEDDYPVLATEPCGEVWFQYADSTRADSNRYENFLSRITGKDTPLFPDYEDIAA